MSHYYYHFRQDSSSANLYLKTANFVVSTGSITVDAGNIVVTAGNITATAGDIIATAGKVTIGNASIINATTTPAMSGHAPGTLCLVDTGTFYVKTGTVGSTTWKEVATL